MSGIMALSAELKSMKSTLTSHCRCSKWLRAVWVAMAIASSVERLALYANWQRSKEGRKTGADVIQDQFFKTLHHSKSKCNWPGVVMVSESLVRLGTGIMVAAFKWGGEGGTGLWKGDVHRTGALCLTLHLFQQLSSDPNHHTPHFMFLSCECVCRRQVGAELLEWAY